MTPILALAALMLAPAPAMADDDAQDLVILGETRPILVRLRVVVGDRPSRAAWLESIHALHARLDRDGDGRLATEEADAGGLALLVAPPGATPSARGRAEADNNPMDGVISVDELAEALRDASGPFRLRAEGTDGRRTDALFEHLDRDKDGDLTRPELAALVGSLRRLDRNDDERIGADEVNPTGTPPPAAPMMGRPARDASVPPVLELVVGESPLRVVRPVLRKYDTGSSRGPGRPDSRLSREEFAIPAEAFASTDANRDGTLNTEELRRYLERAPRDLFIDVSFPADASADVSVRVRGGDGGPPEGFASRQLAEGLVEVDVGAIRLDIRVDDGATAADAARKVFKARFDAADANQDGYLEENELTQDDGRPSPLAPFFRSFDRDGDGKLYPGEIEINVTRRADLALGCLTLTSSDQGRALFGLLDLDRDRQLGAREVLDTFARVSACDRNRDGRVSPDEIPHHIQLTLARGDLSDLLAPAADTPAVAQRAGVAPPPARPAVGPVWFRKMDHNRDGDVSRREFLGTREQFDRLDRDHDGLIAPAEAASAARPVKAPGG